MIYRIISTSILALALAACSSQRQQAQPQAPGTTGAQGMAQGPQAGMCPTAVPGTTVTTENTADGIAMVFTTTDRGNAADLRKRVRHMAEMHNRHHSGQGMRGQGMGQGQGMGRGPMHDGMGQGQGMRARMVPSTAVVTDVDSGARIMFTPRDPQQLAELRTEIRQHAERMASGQCPMMQMG